MADIRIEADHDRIPTAVFHRFNGETWTHPFLDKCEVCERTPRFTLGNRRKVLKRAQSTVEPRTVSPSAAIPYAPLAGDEPDTSAPVHLRGGE